MSRIKDIQVLNTETKCSATVQSIRLTMHGQQETQKLLFAEFQSTDDHVESVRSNHPALKQHSDYLNTRDEFYFGERSYDRNFGITDAILSIQDGVPRPAMYDKFETGISEILSEMDVAEQTEAYSVKRRRKIADNGDEVDIDRYLNNEAECWRTTSRLASRKNIKLFINLSLSCANEEGAFLNIGLEAAMTCDLLEKAGYGVEIWCGAFTSRNGNDHNLSGYAVRVKDSEEALDVGKVLAFGEPYGFRCFGFATMDVHLNNTDFSYGRPVNTIGEERYETMCEAIRQAYGFTHVFTGEEFRYDEEKKRTTSEKIIKTLDEITNIAEAEYEM